MEDKKQERRAAYERPIVTSEAVPLLPLIELSSTPTGTSFGKFRGPPGKSGSGS